MAESLPHRAAWNNYLLATAGWGVLLIMSLMSEIRAFPVPKNSVGIWWLGQNGFIFKSHEGTLVSTDLYLTNSCAESYKDVGVNLDRRVPVLIPPEDVQVDVYTCTHNHMDHT